MNVLDAGAALIAIDLDYSEFTGLGKALLVIAVNRTAVKVEAAPTSATQEVVDAPHS